MADKIQIRRDTAANFTSANPVLSSGEIAYTTDTKELFVGDGVTAFSSLAPYQVTVAETDPVFTASAAAGIVAGDITSWDAKVGEAPIDGTPYSRQDAGWVAAGAGYSDADVDTHLNTSTATTGQVLSYTGADYDWIDAGGGGAVSGIDINTIVTEPTASGTGAMAFGENAQASGISSIALGGQTQTTGQYAVAIGRLANSGIDGIAVGFEAEGGISNVSIGGKAGQNNTGNNNVFIGGRAGQSAAGDSFSNAIVIASDGTEKPATEDGSILIKSSKAKLEYTTANGFVFTEDVGGANTAYDLSSLGGGGGAAALNDLTDVDLTTTPPNLGEFLSYDGANWVPIAGGGVATAGNPLDFDLNIGAGTTAEQDLNIEPGQAVTNGSAVPNNGTVADHAFTISGTGATLTTDRNGVTDSALNLTGLSYVSGAGTPVNWNADFCIMLYAKIDAFPSAAAMVASGFAGSGLLGIAYTQNNTATPQVGIQYAATTSFANVAAATQPVYDQWNHYCLERSSNIVKLYINGVEEASLDVSASTVSATTFLWGAYTNQSGTQDITIDDLKVWDTPQVNGNFDPGVYHGGAVSVARIQATGSATDSDIAIKAYDSGVLTTAIQCSGGGVIMPNLPTSDPVVAGQLWNDAGTLKVSAG